MAETQTKSVKKAKKQFTEGVAYVKATFNNTIITIADPQGNVCAWGSAAKAGFRGSRKSTPFAAQVAASDLGKDVVERFGLRRIHVKIKGPGPGRESSVRALEAAGLKVLSLEDTTGIPHNGCRDPKKRRM